ncbi:hypothetical protein DK389_22050 [Methylobacterium durans]|uniref:Uncharacterized protein n=2 Tax=Methylobacterium durans TaxID=2202825 RepID=A0A2U8W989_9HYPH|nr:hypothetical protein DK389_22050 [Methylobacterium durans]
MVPLALRTFSGSVCAGIWASRMMTTWDATRQEMSHLIAELELLTTVQASTVLALVRIGSDAAAARQCLYEQMGQLNALRREWTVLEQIETQL